MTEFQRILKDSTLFEAPCGTGWTGLVLGRGATDAGDVLPADRALCDTMLQASFLFACQPPDRSSTQALNALANAVLDRVEATGGHRAIVWLLGCAGPDDEMIVLTFSNDGRRIDAALNLRLSTDLDVQISAGAQLALNAEGAGLILGRDYQQTITFTGSGAPSTTGARPGDLVDIAFTGAYSGVLQYELLLQRRCLCQDLGCGFQYLIPSPDPNASRPYIAQWYPLAKGDEPNPADIIFLHAKLTPGLPSHAQFLFSSSGQCLISWFVTPTGVALTLLPVGLDGAKNGALPGGFTVHDGTIGAGLKERGTFLFSPQGDFVLQIPNAKDGDTAALLCGLNATETISFRPKTAHYVGDRLRFTSGQSAFVPSFPIVDASPLTTPFDPRAKLLSSSFLTSYGTVLCAPEGGGAPHYCAQPEGARLFGKESTKDASAGLLWPSAPGQLLAQPPAELTFPIVPYSGVVPGDGESGMTTKQMTELEAQLLAPVRKQAICGGEPTFSLSALYSLGLARGDGTKGSHNIVTPSGVLTTLSDTGVWERIQLGQNTGEDACVFAFEHPDAALQQAFQTNQLCLVVANAVHLEALKDDGEAESARFLNEVLMDGWGLSADVGQSNRYGDYNNVLIVKSCSGRLLDLVRSPDSWTMPADFAAPTTLRPDGTLSPPDIDQLVILSQWLQDYLERALCGDSEFYQAFVRIIKDENWSGILALKTRVTKLPHDLVGLTAGLDAEQFYAHHFAVSLCGIDPQTVTQRDASSMYGLIDYKDSAYANDEQPIPPRGGDYDFQVLRLQALFENTAVKRFYSLAQLTLRRLFDDRVSGMGANGNGYNALLLHGGYQDNGGAPVYRLTSSKADSFLLDGCILRKVKITGAQMTTLDAGESGDETVSLIAMTGLMVFDLLSYQDEDGTKHLLDLFSFGPEDPASEEGRGLVFTDLGIRITQSSQSGARTLCFESGSISLSPASPASLPRKQSLCRQFALVLEGLSSGDSKTSPDSLGYLPVVTDCRFSDLGERWNALRFRLCLGTPGALAGKLDLSATLLLAWAPGGEQGGGPRAYVGLKLPGTGGGAKLLSLENILKLSIGTLRLTSDKKRNAFVLLLSEIALKFLGIKGLPPNGSTAFYLFGDPDGAENTQGLGWYTAYNQSQKKQEIAHNPKRTVSPNA